MQPAVKIKNLSVTLGRNYKALKHVDLELPAGRISGFIGPSGAGKTTLIRVIVGRLQASHGSVRLFDLPAGASQLRRQVAYMTQELSVYPDLTVRENLHYFARMAGQSRAKARLSVSQALTTVDLADRADHLVSNLSGGQKQRVSLAIALLSSPRLLVLDEPTVGLDPVLREKLWQLFRQLAEQGNTLIISSHSMDEAERCDHLVLIRDGEAVAQSSPAALLHQTGTDTVEKAFLKLAGEHR